MSKKRNQEYEWEIIRIKGTPAAHLGRVDAPDAEKPLAKHKR